MTLCPICIQRISSFAMATGKIVQINGILYHIACCGELRIADLEHHQIQGVKHETVSDKQ